MVWAFLLPQGCASTGAVVEFYLAEGYSFSSAERREIERIVQATVREVQPLLPRLPDEVVVRVRADPNVIPETGQTGSAFPPRVVAWHVDPQHPAGVSEVARQWLRACLYHELHHLVRHTTEPIHSLADRAISEGLATAFERDFGGTSPPWGRYPPDASAWALDLLKRPPDGSAEAWNALDSDGQRWKGYKAGIYLVDHAMRNSAQSSADLVRRSTGEIIAMAGAR